MDDGGDLGLCRLGLLVAAEGSLLLLHLLVAEGSERAGNLLDLVTRKLLGQLLGEFLQEERVVSLLGRARDNGSQGIAEVRELRFGRRVEEGQVGNVHGVVGIVGINNDGRTDSGSLAAVADTNVTEEVLRVGEIGILLGAAEALTALGRSLIVFAELCALVTQASTLSLVLGDTLGL